MTSSDPSEAGRHARASELLAAALRLPVEEQAAFLVRGAGGDAALLAHASALLASAQQLGDFLEGPGPGAAAVIAAAQPDSADHEVLPDRIGSCRILGLRGQGAMGVVYEGWQETLKRRVAVKILRSVFPTQAARRRFELEGELLGRLRHPGITEVYEAGFEELGPGRIAPYLVMELVEGVPITQHCEARQLSRRERVELLAQACEAAGFAHEQGVMHRDYKPDNVLVTGDGRVKLVDFGMACVAADTSITRHTRTGDVIGTLAYMSPEQAAGHALEVDARSDVHALGILAFELLVGHLPLDLEKLSLLQALHAVRERDTIRMTTLDPTLRGGLDAIVGKAVAIDRRHRYEDASAMAADLRRYLAGAPVQASPPSIAERIRHRAWRHRRLVRTLAAVVLALSVGFVLTLITAVKEARQHRRADAMLALANWTQYVGAINRAREYLDEDNVAAARTKLERTEPSARGWEWRYLEARLDGSLETIRTPLVTDLRGAVASDRSLVMWSGSMGARVTWGSESIEKASPESGCWPGVWSADLLRVACRIGETWVVRDILTRRELTLPEPIRGNARTIAFDPSGERLLALLMKPSLAIVVDARSGRMISTSPVPAGEGRAAWSPDGSRYAVSGRRDAREMIEIHDAADGSVTTRVPGPAAVGPRFSPDGTRVLGQTNDKLVESWDLETGSRSWAFDAGAFGKAVDFTLSPRGDRVVMTTKEGEGLLLAASDGQVVAMLPRATRTAFPARPAFSPDGRMLAVPLPLGAMGIVDPLDGRPLASLLGHSMPVVFIASVDGGRRLVSVDAQGEARSWDPATPHADVLRGHSSYVYGVAFSGDGSRLASAGWDGTVRLWDVGSGDPITVLRAPEGIGAYGQVSFSPEGDVLASVHDMTVSLWDTTSGQSFATLELAEFGYRGELSPGRAPRSIAWGRSGDLLAVASLTRDVQVWRLASSRDASPSHEVWPARAEALAFSPSGDLAALAVGEGVEIWTTDPPGHLRHLGGHDGEIFALAFSPDGSRLASAGADRTVRVWSVDGLRPPAVLKGHAEKVYAVAFSPDGSRIASGGNDDVVRIWSAESGDALLVLAGHDSYVHAVAFSPDGSVLASGSGDGTVRLWDAAPDRVRLLARAARLERIEEMGPRVDRLFAEEGDARRVAARLLAEPGSAEERQVGLDLALARGAARPRSAVTPAEPPPERD